MIFNKRLFINPNETAFFIRNILCLTATNSSDVSQPNCYTVLIVTFYVLFEVYDQCKSCLTGHVSQ